MDQPPLVPLLARLAETVFGAATLTPGELRGFGTLASAATVMLGGLMARELGGGRFAQGFAALTVLVMPLFLGAGGSFGTVVFDQLLWATVLWLVLRTLRTGEGRGWMLVGICAGVGLEVKHTMGLLGLGLAAALVFTPAGRRHLRTPWPWLGGAVALGFLLPNLLWQHAHGWPTLEFIHNNNERMRQEWTLPGFIGWQVLFVGPWEVPLMALGLWHARPAAGKAGTQAVRVIFAVVLGALLVLRGKPYYLGSIYPALAAAGSVALEELTTAWLARHEGRGRWLRPALVSGSVLCALPLLPVVLPLVPRDRLAGSWESKINHDFPEEIGWQELTAQVEGIFLGLPDEERARTTVLTVNYGEAAAIERFGRIPAGQMPLVSPHNNYWLWGPGAREPQTLLVVGARHRDWMEELYGRVELVATIDNPLHIANEEQGRGIYLCRGPKKTLRAAWLELKGFG